MFRKRPDRIRGIAGSLDNRRVLVADSVYGAGPGIARVMAEAGARVQLITPIEVDLDLQLRDLANTPEPVSGRTAPMTTLSDLTNLMGDLDPAIDAAIINPSGLDLGPSSETTNSQLTPQSAAELATLVATNMRDRGIEGSIVIVTGIPQRTPAGPAVAFLTAEMERLAAESAPNAIRVNAVAPGHVAVGRRGRAVSSGAGPLGHVSVHPVEVGKAAWFFVNDDLSYGMTGSTLTIDRGASLLRPEW
ncbi:MAG: SDR family oxidoreductase [Acidimicrobiia bacterium]